MSCHGRRFPDCEVHMSLRVCVDPRSVMLREPSHSPSDNLGPLFCCVVSLGNQGRLGPVCVAVEWISMATQTHTHCCVWKAGGASLQPGARAAWGQGDRRPAITSSSSQGFRPLWDVTGPTASFLRVARTCTQYPA